MVEGRDERGLALSVWATMALPAFIIAVGIGVDFAGHTTAEQEARSVAAQAARAATHEVVLTGGGVAIDVPRAKVSAVGFAATAGYPATVTVSGGQRATVTIAAAYDTVFLGLIGIHEIGYEVTGTARIVATTGGG